MVKFGLRQHPSEASVNVSSGSDYFWLLVWFGMVLIGLVWLLTLMEQGSWMLLENEEKSQNFHEEIAI